MFEGWNGAIVVTPETVKIIYGNRHSKGEGEKEIILESIQSIELKKPRFLAQGYIQLILEGSKKKKGALAAMGDEHSIMINDEAQYKQFEQAKALIESFQHEQKLVSEQNEKGEGWREDVFEGKNGTLIVTPEAIKIIYNWLHRRGRGEKTISIRSISSIQLKKMGKITVGYIQFTFQGSLENQSRSTFNALDDQNTISIANDAQFEDFKRAKALIESYQNQLYAPQIQSSSTSGADELKKYKELLDDGIISEEEFNAKKKQILGI
jgi:hypothetical protein